MSFSDLLAADVDTVFLGHDEFEEDVVYTPAGGSGSTISAVVEDLQDITGSAMGGFDGDQLPGAAAIARIYVSATDVANPSYRDTITQGSTTWTVNQKSKQGGMWVLYCTSSQRMQY